MLAHTGVNRLLSGRAAQGRPWFFDVIRYCLGTGDRLPEKPSPEVGAILVEHLESLHAFYGEYRGVRIARKHLGWYARAHPGSESFLRIINRVDSASRQVAIASEYFERSGSTITEAA